MTVTVYFILWGNQGPNPWTSVLRNTLTVTPRPYSPRLPRDRHRPGAPALCQPPPQLRRGLGGLRRRLRRRQRRVRRVSPRCTHRGLLAADGLAVHRDDLRSGADGLLLDVSYVLIICNYVWLNCQAGPLGCSSCSVDFLRP